VAPAAQAQAPRSYSLIGQPAAEFDFPKLSGGRARLSDYQGRPFVLVFGGLWCVDCVVDGANINRLANDIAAEAGAGFLYLHVGNSFGRWGVRRRTRSDAMNAYFAETGYNYPVAFCDGFEWVQSAYATQWYPTYLVINREGIITHWRTRLGRRGAEQFLSIVRGEA
jgi:thiol-disulfide isomerase/thioredoxin